MSNEQLVRPLADSGQKAIFCVQDVGRNWLISLIRGRANGSVSHEEGKKFKSLIDDVLSLADAAQNELNSRK